MLSERSLRFVILIGYGYSLLNMWWTGAMYRFVGAASGPLELVGGILAGVIAAGALSGREAESGEDMAGGLWLRGVLYALFALPPAIYLLTMYAGW